jgi:predicted TIM-barrel fold metal-dependent hydrolase
MLSRRDFLIAAGVSAIATVKFDVPAGACDCHTHIFGDPRRFPFVTPRVYTPPTASITEMRALHRKLRTSRVVIVQPSVYGADNSCTIDAIKELGPGARGIAAIDEKTSDATLDQMDRQGIRGIRINLETSGQADPAVARQRLQAAMARIKGRKWHIELYTRLSVIESIHEQVLAATVPISFDHFGGAQGPLGIHQPGFNTLLSLLHAGKAYVKISAPYRSSTLSPDFPDVVPLAKALIAANPQRIIWGTDWPHPMQIPGKNPTEITPFYQVDDGRDLNQLIVWAPDSALRKTILVDNPARLYGF